MITLVLSACAVTVSTFTTTSSVAVSPKSSVAVTVKLVVSLTVGLYVQSVETTVAGSFVFAQEQLIGCPLSALALSPALRMPAERLGWINLFGLGGTAVGVAIGAPIRSDTGTQIGVVAGSLVGLVSGVIATGYMRFSDHVALGVDGDMALARSSHGPRTTRRASGGRARTAAPPSASSGRLPSFIADWAPTVSMQPGIDPHTGGATGGDGALIFGVRGRLH